MNMIRKIGYNPKFLKSDFQFILIEKLILLRSLLEKITLNLKIYRNITFSFSLRYFLNFWLALIFYYNLVFNHVINEPIRSLEEASNNQKYH